MRGCRLGRRSILLTLVTATAAVEFPLLRAAEPALRVVRVGISDR